MSVEPLSIGHEIEDKDKNISYKIVRLLEEKEEEIVYEVQSNNRFYRIEEVFSADCMREENGTITCSSDKLKNKNDNWILHGNHNFKRHDVIYKVEELYDAGIRKRLEKYIVLFHFAVLIGFLLIGCTWLYFYLQNERQDKVIQELSELSNKYTILESDVNTTNKLVNNIQIDDMQQIFDRVNQVENRFNQVKQELNELSNQHTILESNIDTINKLVNNIQQVENRFKPKYSNTDETLERLNKLEKIPIELNTFKYYTTFYRRDQRCMRIQLDVDLHWNIYDKHKVTDIRGCQDEDKNTYNLIIEEDTKVLAEKPADIDDKAGIKSKSEIAKFRFFGAVPYRYWKKSIFLFLGEKRISVSYQADDNVIRHIDSKNLEEISNLKNKTYLFVNSYNEDLSNATSKHYEIYKKISKQLKIQKRYKSLSPYPEVGFLIDKRRK